MATDDKGTMRWCHGFKLHLMCNDSGEIITFCLTGANVDDRDKRVWTVFAKELYGKVFADKGYIKQALFEDLFDRGIHLVHGLRAKAYAHVGQDHAPKEGHNAYPLLPVYLVVITCIYVQ